MGCVIWHNNNIDLINKLHKFQHVWATLNRRLKTKTIRETQIKSDNVILVPVLMCGSENFVLNRADSWQIETAEIKFMWWISGLSLCNHGYMTHTQLAIFSLGERIQEHTNQWHEHCFKMEHNRIAQRNEI